MDAELKAKWVKALRSGEYRQGRNKLRDGNSYCCLGVLACVAEMKISKDGDAVIRGRKRAAYEPIVDLVGYQNKARLIDMNDLGSDFYEIADYIEREL